ncbi:hypothetical protein [Clostridium lundense]|uniref:hypothetical protein n=1 Tax=Clostridium lundense TaxID=319475 RepID=UPI0012EB7313|nr:hypothetical protein [Clostridium lundense]
MKNFKLFILTIFKMNFYLILLCVSVLILNLSFSINVDGDGRKTTVSVLCVL